LVQMAHVLAPHIIRRKDGKVHRYWCLVRSVRVGRRVIQQTAAQPDERVRIEARVLARRLIGAPEEAPPFNDSSGQGNASKTTSMRSQRCGAVSWAPGQLSFGRPA
jgi:hypothetical protein